MMETIKVRGITIGEGMPKVCIPMIGHTIEHLKEEATLLKTLDFDVVEWRVDFFEHVEEIAKVKEALQEIRGILPHAPLIFTFRSAKEGGEKSIRTSDYIELNSEIIKTKAVDIIDVELFNEEKHIRELIDRAHENNVFVIISNHDFDKTPAKGEIISRLRKAQELGGDIPKIAVMPTNTKDVLILLDATREMKELYADRPIITMSMSGKGVISRIACEVFGSALTFGAAKHASAPGQVAVADLRNTLNLLHNNLQ
ncbi:type I 3-dehydroquinate dehydratase [Oceanobacillus bengalensis]|uniref:3-dehydroquinate dehydratase n=1 Tax=Oceanobacillus bengalensis TaxID=1435466 RepID=A0A494YU60_9BACI|nr:type I 3-dehydroquinate dehydratase [Oceanobacillus bengalensis]RKQ13635.1 type I 3-dehydroquinate dehydratase [Oceanobacillus bengalensis]